MNFCRIQFIWAIKKIMFWSQYTHTHTWYTHQILLFLSKLIGNFLLRVQFYWLYLYLYVFFFWSPFLCVLSKTNTKKMIWGGVEFALCIALENETCSSLIHTHTYIYLWAFFQLTKCFCIFSCTKIYRLDLENMWT